MVDDGAITLVSGSPARKLAVGQSPLSCVGASVENLARCLALELAPIRVNVVSPGTINTAKCLTISVTRRKKPRRV